MHHEQLDGVMRGVACTAQEGESEDTGRGKGKKRAKKAAGQGKRKGKNTGAAPASSFAGGTASFMSAAALLSKK